MGCHLGTKVNMIDCFTSVASLIPIESILLEKHAGVTPRAPILKHE